MGNHTSSAKTKQLTHPQHQQHFPSSSPLSANYIPTYSSFYYFTQWITNFRFYNNITAVQTEASIAITKLFTSQGGPNDNNAFKIIKALDQLQNKNLDDFNYIELMILNQDWDKLVQNSFNSDINVNEINDSILNATDIDQALKLRNLNLHNDKLILKLYPLLEELYKVNNSKFRKILIKGPPNNLRWMLWMTAAKMAYVGVSVSTCTSASANTNTNEQQQSTTPCDSVTLTNSHIYKCLLAKKLKDKRKQQILNDIALCDTFPFKNQPEQEHLMFNILKAMCLYDDKLKYMKGMDVISGYFLTLSDLNEEQTFLMMRYFYSSEYGIKFRTCLFPNSYRINLFCFTMNELLLERFPNIHSKIIRRMNIAYDLWYGKWVKSLFWTQFPLGICVRFWDCLVGCGLVYMYNLILGIVKFSERRIEQCEDEEEFLKCFEYDLSTDEKVVEVREKIIEFGREFTISKALLDKIEEMFKESDEYRYNADMDMEDEKGSDEGEEEERMGMGIGIGGNNERNRIRDLMEEIKMKVSDGEGDGDGEGDENGEEEDEGSEDGEEKGRRRVMRKDDGDNANSDGEGDGDSEEEEESNVGYTKKKKKKNNNNSNDDGDSMEVNSEHIPNSLSNINLSYLNEEHFNYNVKDVHRNNCDYEQPTNEVTLLIKDGIQNDSRLSDVSLDDDDL